MKELQSLLITLSLLLVCALANDDFVNVPGRIMKRTFPPPDPNLDVRTAVVSSGSGLNTGCTYASGGPLVITLEIPQYIAPTDNEGRLLPEYLPLVPSFMQIKLPAFDVDYDGTPTPERDLLSFNGNSIDYLTGLDNLWIMNTFSIPTQIVKFARVDTSTGRLIPGINEIQVDIDVLTGNSWCTSVQWVAMYNIPELVYPTLFVHGFNSDSSIWQLQWIPWMNDHSLPWSVINLNNIIAVNAASLAAQVAGMTQDFKCTKVSIVAHSKGGIDSRHLLMSNKNVKALVQLQSPNCGASSTVSPALCYFFGAIKKAACLELSKANMNYYNKFINTGPNPATSYNSAGSTKDWVVPAKSATCLSYSSNNIFASFGHSINPLYGASAATSYYCPKLFPAPTCVGGVKRGQTASTPAPAALKYEQTILETEGSATQTTTIPFLVSSGLAKAGNELHVTIGWVHSASYDVDPGVQSASQQYGTSDPDATLDEPYDGVTIYSQTIKGAALLSGQYSATVAISPSTQQNASESASVTYFVSVFVLSPTATTALSLSVNPTNGRKSDVYTFSITSPSATIVPALQISSTDGSTSVNLTVTRVSNTNKFSATFKPAQFLSFCGRFTATASVYSSATSTQLTTSEAVGVNCNNVSISAVNVFIVPQPGNTSFNLGVAVQLTLDGASGVSICIAAELWSSKVPASVISLVFTCPSLGVTSAIFPGDDIVSAGIEGPWVVKNVRLFSVTDGVQTLVQIKSGPFSVPSALVVTFRPYGSSVLALANFTESALDLNGDRLFDSLTATLSFFIPYTSPYYIQATVLLSDKGGSVISAKTSNFYAAPIGQLSLITVTFAGDDIRASGAVGPLHIGNVAIYSPQDGTSFYVLDTVTTRSYSYLQFGSAPTSIKYLLKGAVTSAAVISTTSDLIAIGTFTRIGGKPASGVMRFVKATGTWVKEGVLSGGATSVCACKTTMFAQGNFGSTNLMTKNISSGVNGAWVPAPTLAYTTSGLQCSASMYCTSDLYNGIACYRPSGAPLFTTYIYSTITKFSVFGTCAYFVRDFCLYKQCSSGELQQILCTTQTISSYTAGPSNSTIVAVASPHFLYNCPATVNSDCALVTSSVNFDGPINWLQYSSATKTLQIGGGFYMLSNSKVLKGFAMAKLTTNPWTFSAYPQVVNSVAEQNPVFTNVYSNDDASVVYATGAFTMVDATGSLGIGLIQLNLKQPTAAFTGPANCTHIESCSGHGRCLPIKKFTGVGVATPGVCACSPGYGGATCSASSYCPNECNTNATSFRCYASQQSSYSVCSCSQNGTAASGTACYSYSQQRPCSGTTIIDAVSTYNLDLSSNFYPNNANCSYLLDFRASTTKRWAISISSLTLGRVTDSVTFYNGENSSAPVLAKYDVNNTNNPATLIATANQVLMRIRSDGAYVARLPYISWVSRYVCDPTQVLSSPTGAFVDSDSFVHDGTNCTWLISPSNAVNRTDLYVSLQISYLYLDEGSSLYIYDGTSDAAPLIASRTGYVYSSSLSFSSSGGFMFVKLVSSASISHQTISATYTTLNSSNVYCSGIKRFNQSSGSFSDHVGYLTYQNFASCYWVIAPLPLQTNRNITLSFSSFYTESGYDYLRVYDSTDPSLPLGSSLATYNYHLAAFNQTFLSTSGGLVLYFTSDSSVQYSGFSLSFSA